MVSLLLPKFALCHSLFFYKSKPDTLKVIRRTRATGLGGVGIPPGSRPCARHCIGISRTRLVGRGIDHFRCRHSRPRSPPFRSAPAAAPVLPRRRPVRALRRPPPPAECARRPTDLTFGHPASHCRAPHSRALHPQRPPPPRALPAAAPAAAPLCPARHAPSGRAL